MWNCLDKFFGWVLVVGLIVAGPLFVILGLASGHWGYAIFGALVSIFGAYLRKKGLWNVEHDILPPGNRGTRPANHD